MGPGKMQEMIRQHQGMMPMGGHAGMHAASTTPTMPGQDAFGAIQEIVQILDADPKTDWSKVDLEALRQHLIDMNEVTLRADAAPKQIDCGLEIAVTGNGRTLVAIQRMVPAWARMMNGQHGWTAKADTLPNGATHGHRHRSEGNRAHSRSWLHRPSGERFDASAPPSCDGKGRVQARAPGPGPVNQFG